MVPGYGGEAERADVIAEVMWGDRNWDLNENSIVLPICFLTIKSCTMATDRLGSDLDPNSTTSNANSSTHTLLFCNMDSDREFTSYSPALGQSKNLVLGFQSEAAVFFSAASVGAHGRLLLVRFPQWCHRPQRHKYTWKGPLWISLDFGGKWKKEDFSWWMLK